MAKGIHSNGKGFLGSVVSFLVMLAIIVCGYFALRTYVVGTYTIPSGSMMETIQIGDYIFSEKVTYYTRPVQQGDIVTFQAPAVVANSSSSSHTANDVFIKRVIAVGGQTVDLQDGYVYVDGVKLNESYTGGKPSYPLADVYGVDITYPYTVPDGYIWVMGDNRTNSSDSRAFGAIPETSVTGKGCFIYWPLNRIGVLN